MPRGLTRVVLFLAILGASMAVTAMLVFADQPGEIARGSGSISTFIDFNFQAHGDQFNTGATGRIKTTFPSSDPNQQFSGDIDCLLLVSPNRAVMSGPLTNVQPSTLFFSPDRFIAFAEDNGPSGGSAGNPDRFDFFPFESAFNPGLNCQNPFFFFFGLPITKGDIDVSPGQH